MVFKLNFSFFFFEEKVWPGCHSQTGHEKMEQPEEKIQGNLLFSAFQELSGRACLS